jgi:hypothetical protein
MSSERTRESKDEGELYKHLQREFMDQAIREHIVRNGMEWVGKGYAVHYETFFNIAKADGRLAEFQSTSDNLKRRILINAALIEIQEMVNKQEEPR